MRLGGTDGNWGRVGPLLHGGAACAAVLAALLLTAASAGAACVGDCNDSNDVRVDELVTCVNIALDRAQLSQCLAIETNTDGQATINELITAVNNALRGCQAVPTPTPDLGNQPPQVDAGDDVISAIDQPPTLTGSATDDGMPSPPATLTLAWSKVSGPGTVVFGSPNAGTTTATFSEVGSYVLRLTANDSARTGSDDVTVHVDIAAANVGPRLDPIDDQTITAGSALSLGLVGRDDNPFDTLSYSLVSGPDGARVADATFGFAPLAAQLGTHAVTVRVQDQDGLTADTSFDVTVVAANQSPAFDPLADVTTPIGVLFTTTLTASDSDAGDTLTFTLLSAPPGMTLNGAVLSWTPTPDQFGTHIVSVAVSDGRGGDSPDALRILVPAPGAPKAREDSYQTVVGQTLTVSAPGVLANDSSVDGGAITAERLTQPDKGSVSAFAPDGSFTYVAPPSLPPPPPLDAALRYDVHLGNAVHIGPYPPLVANVDGSGSPEIIFWDGDILHVVHGENGAALFTANVLPEPFDDCAMYGREGSTFAVGDVDDDGAVEIVMGAQCARDNRDYIYVIGNASRVIALAYDAEAPEKFRVKWLSEPLAAQVPADPGDGHLYVAYGGVAGFASYAIARLRPEENPTILLGRVYTGGPCPVIFPGKTDTHCRVVFAVDGADGAVKAPYYATPPEPGAVDIEYGFTAYGGQSSPIVADIDNDDALDIVYRGTVWEVDGSVKRHLDGTAANRVVNDSLVADLDGDPEMEIVTLDNVNHRRNSLIQAWKPDGRLLWRAELPSSTVVSRLFVADVDRSGRPTILYVVFETIFALDHTGQLKWLRRVPMSHLPGLELPAYDFNGDGIIELALQTSASTITFLRGDTGEPQTSWTYPGATDSQPQSAQAPVIADVDSSGAASLVFYHDVNANDHSFLQVLKGDSAPWRPAPEHMNQRAYWETNFNPDGSVPATYTRHTAEPHTNVFRQQPPIPYASEPRLRRQTSFTYTAQDDALASQPATVTIEILPENRPPLATLLPPPTVQSNDYRGAPGYTFQMTGVDPDPGDVVSFELTTQTCGAAGAVSISPEGLFRFQDFAFDDTLCFFQARLSDGNGGVTDAAFSIFFTRQPRTVPNVVGLPRSEALIEIAKRDLVSGREFAIPNTAPAGQVLAQNPPAETIVPRSSAVQLTVSLGPGPLDTDDDGDGFTENQGDCDDNDTAFSPALAEIPDNGIDENCDGSERIVREIVVEPRSALRVTGEQINYAATAVYIDGTSAEVAANWVSSAPTIAGIDAAGLARALNIGSTTITATFGGAVGRATFSVGDRAAGDQDDPTAIIAAPTGGASVTGLTQIIGTASDANFLRYELAVALTSNMTFKTIGGGTSAVIDGALGTLDPTMLMNEIHTLRLTVWDANGNQATVESTVQIEGEQKVGNFTLVFSDLSVPVSGIPIEVVRTYDSRDKREGDFGIGWRLGLNTLQVSTNRVLGTGWQVIKPGLAFGLQATDEHFVSVTVSSGRVERFRLVIEPAVSPLVPLTSVRARFAPRPGALGTLESLDNNELLITDSQPGEVTLLDDTSLNEYDPDRFRYTTPDGTQFIVSRRSGLESIREPNGNQISVGPDSITHSAGASVAFTRDTQGRITTLADALGQAQTYAYDTNGDLVSHTDRAGAITRFRYARNHNLLEIVGPNGVRATRNEYDADGRLIASIDPDGNRFEYDHDVGNRLEIQRDPGGAQRGYAYDERGNVLAATDELGHTTLRTYDAHDRMVSQTDPLGRTMTLTYDADGREQSRSDHLGQTISYSYGTAGQLSSVTDALGQTATFMRDARGNPTQYRDAEGHITTFTYDASGNLTQRTDAEGRVTQYEYDGRGQRTAIVDALGNRTDLTRNGNGDVTSISTQITTPSGPRTLTFSAQYDGEGRPTQIVDADGRMTAGEYDVAGNLTAIVDPIGRRTEMEYNERGQRIATTLPDGTVLSAMYDLQGRATQTTDRNGQPILSDYNAVGNLTRVTLPGGFLGDERDNPTHQLEYDAARQLTGLIDPTGNRTELEYDAAGQIIAGADALGPATSVTRDALGRVTSQTDAIGRVTRFEYDGLSRLTRAINPDASAVSYAYDAVGNVVAYTDAEGHITRFEYDGNNQLNAVIDALGGRTEYAYDELGRLVRVRNAAGRDTQFEYDNRGLRTATVLPMGQRETRTYDAAGRLSSITDFNGARSELSYDALDRLIERRLPGGEIESFTYGTLDTILTMTNARGTTRFTYDGSGRLASRIEPDGRSIKYTYDASNRVTSVTTAAGTTRLEYDTVGRLVRVTDPDGGITGYGYDAAGNLVTTTLPNGVIETRVYDARNRLTSLTTQVGAGAPIVSFASTYDDNDNRIEILDQTGRRTTYTYDAMSRIVQERITPDTGPVRTIDYTWDAVGNRLTRTDSVDGQTTYTYDANDRLISTSGGGATTTYTYDHNGNRLTQVRSPTDQSTFTWDGRNRLTSVEQTANGDTSLATYGYDPTGTRVAQTVDGIETRYLLDVQRRFEEVVEEYSASGQTFASYALGIGRLSRRTSAGRQYFHTDPLGSTRALTNGGAAVLATATYDAFGRTLEESGELSPFQFAGEQRDPVTGFTHLRARQLDNDTGRFVSSDPFPGLLDAPMSLHRYLYANDNPVNLRDPSGKVTLTQVAVAVSILATLASINNAVTVIGELSAGRLNVTWDGPTLDFTANAPAGFFTGIGVTHLTTKRLDSSRLKGRYTRGVHVLFYFGASTRNAFEKYFGGKGDDYAPPPPPPTKKGPEQAPRIGGLDALLVAGHYVVGLPSFAAVDVNYGSSTLHSSSLLSGIESTTLSGGYTSVALSGSLGFVGAIDGLLLRQNPAEIHSGFGVSATIQGFAGGLNKNYFLSWVPSVSGAYQTGASIDFTPVFWNNQVDPRPPS